MHLLKLTALMVCALATTLQAGGPLTVTTLSPAPGTVALPTANIALTFDRALDPATVTADSFRVYGRWSGPAEGAVTFSNANQTVTLNPTASFMAGEEVIINLASSITGADAVALRSAGYAAAFRIAVQPSTRSFVQIDSFSNRSPSLATTRIYGASAADMNNDGYPDLTTVNEVSADLRVFLNLADGSGLYGDFLSPFPIGDEASPNDAADFNNDGAMDIVVSATSSGSTWICLGDGAGGFLSSQALVVGTAPHGVVALDVDGDADLDVVTASSSASNLSLMINDGTGTFGAAQAIATPGNAEYGLAAGDMNEDGITDLVVGARDSQTVLVLVGNGDGTFTHVETESCGGSVWVVTLGDVNGDGHLDVSTANSGSNNAAILLGDGAAGLGTATVYSNVASHVVSTDLGDLDGDGDLDWVISSFGSGLWDIYVNDGAGNFTFDQTFDAQSNASCAVLLDFDRDGDLDLALTDEIADVIELHENQGGGPTVPAASEWGLIVLALGLIGIAGVILQRRRAAPQQVAVRTRRRRWLDDDHVM